MICTGTSDTHVKTIHDALSNGMYERSQLWKVEGLNSLNWVLMDFVDTVIHIFQKEHREFYSIERLWADGNIETIKDDFSNINNPLQD